MWNAYAQVYEFSAAFSERLIDCQLNVFAAYSLGNTHFQRECITEQGNNECAEINELDLTGNLLPNWNVSIEFWTIWIFSRHLHLAMLLFNRVGQDGTARSRNTRNLQRNTSVKMLDYSYSSLQEVARICEELPALQMLDLSSSRIALNPVGILPAISSLRTLVLNSCALKWKQVCWCSGKWVLRGSAGVAFVCLLRVKQLTSGYSVRALAIVISDLNSTLKHVVPESELPRVLLVFPRGLPRWVPF